MLKILTANDTTVIYEANGMNFVRLQLQVYMITYSNRAIMLYSYSDYTLHTDIIL